MSKKLELEFKATKKHQVILLAIQHLLDIQAIEVVPPEERDVGVYSPILCEGEAVTVNITSQVAQRLPSLLGISFFLQETKTLLQTARDQKNLPGFNILFL